MIRAARRLALHISASLLMALTATSCSNSGTQYRIPDDLCDLGLPQDSYQALFPPGEEVSVRIVDFETGGMRCHARVGKLVPVVIKAELRSGTFDVTQPAASDPHPSGEGHAVPGEYEARAWPGYARAVILCEHDGTTRPLNVSISADHPSDDVESRDILAELIQPLAEALSSHCPGGTSARAG
jgi:hypothetical protein